MFGLQAEQMPVSTQLLEINMLTQSRLKECLDYNPDTGEFTWMENQGSAKKGDSCKCQDSHGYSVIKIDRKKYYAHRLAWLYVYGDWPVEEIDHINGRRADNRACNLRDVCSRVNQQNLHNWSTKHESGYLGVFAHRHGRWRARIRHEGRSTNLGIFDTPEEASQAYLKAKRELHEGCTI